VPRFEKENAPAKVITNAGGPQELRTRSSTGAAADVFASSDVKHMDALAAQGLVIAPAIFACNEPVVVVRPALAATVKTYATCRVRERCRRRTEVPSDAYHDLRS